MRKLLSSSFALCLAATAFAGDDPKAPAKPADPKQDAAAQKERKAAPEGEAALRKFAGLLAFPTPSLKAIRAQATTENPMLGGEVKFDLDLAEDAEPKIEAKLSEAAMQSLPPEQVEVAKAQLVGMFRMVSDRLFARVEREMLQYDVEHKVEGGKQVVDWKKRDPKAAFDRRTLWVDEDGLVRKEVVVVNVDPNDPNAQAVAGADITAQYSFVKKGERYAVDTVTVSMPMGDFKGTVTYYEAGGVVLPREVSVATPFSEQPMVFKFSDYVVNGKPVAGTEKAAGKPKPGEGAPKDPPKDGGKPAPK